MRRFCAVPGCSRAPMRVAPFDPGEVCWPHREVWVSSGEGMRAVKIAASAVVPVADLSEGRCWNARQIPVITARIRVAFDDFCRRIAAEGRAAR